jgi:pyrroloquinoline quinone biosynthesis protein D
MNPLAERPSVNPHFRLQWEEVQQAWVLLYPEGLVKLNRSAGEIMRRCDGSRSVPEIVAELEAVFSASGLAGEVGDFLGMAAEQRWVEMS